MARIDSSLPAAALDRERVSLAGCVAGALSVFVLAESGAWCLSLWSTELGARVSLLLLVLLPIIGFAATFRGVRSALGQWFGKRGVKGGSPVRCYLLGAVIAVFALVAWHSSIMCWRDMIRSMSTGVVEMSPWMYSMWIPFLSAVLALRTLIILLRIPARRA